MFGVYFGKYLQDIGRLTTEQYDTIVDLSRRLRTKLGLLAVEEGLLTQKQADEINAIQQIRDAKFGDIAIERGYLTQGQVDELAASQEDSYLMFVQAIIESGLMGLEEIQDELNRFKRAEKLSALDIDAMKKSDIDRIIPIFLRSCKISEHMHDYLLLMMRNINRFVDNRVLVMRLEEVPSYTGHFIAAQRLAGEENYCIAICGEGTKVIAEKFGKEEFPEIDEDCLDACCEFINVTNGLFASKLSEDGVRTDMLPPEMDTDIKTIRTDGKLYVLPCYIRETRTDIVICADTEWEIS